MKRSVLLLTLLTLYLSANAQNFSIKANMNTASGVQKDKLRNVYGIGGALELPVKKLHPFLLTAGLDLGINGFKNMPYELRFNSSTTNTNVQYTSYLVHLKSGLKYIQGENKNFAPYAAISAGALSYYTEMSIEDPKDPSGCSPIQTKPVSFSMVLTGVAEAGVRIATKAQKDGKTSFLEAGVGYVAGTKGKYIRLHQKEHSHGEDDYVVKFKQNSTGEIHEHSIGTTYRTLTSQLAFHVAFVSPL